MPDPKPILPGKTLTVVIRDDSPLFFNDAPTFRSVRVELTEEQRQALSLKWTHRRGGDFFETVSRVFIEPQPGEGRGDA